MPKASVQSGWAQDPLPRFEPDMARLARLPAWERAKVYAIAGIGLAERSMLEVEVRARIAAEYRRAAR